MRFSLRRSRPSQLLLAWSVYWIGLALVTLRPAIAALWRLARPGAHGSANVGFTNNLLSATILDGARTVWSGSITFLNLALFIAIPPLLLWLIWLAGSARMNNATGIDEENDERPELNAAEQGIGIIEPSTSKRHAREES
jgi:hypothetical protein